MFGLATSGGDVRQALGGAIRGREVQIGLHAELVLVGAPAAPRRRSGPPPRLRGSESLPACINGPRLTLASAAISGNHLF